MENQKYKILLVDDEADIIEFLSYNLKREGYSILTSNNGVDAIQLALHEIPHLILLDVMMPEMDGMEVCEKLRHEPSLSGVIIAFLTARSEDYSQIAGLDAGADDYISKPIKPKLLVSRIKALLRRFEVPASQMLAKPDDDGIFIDKDKYRVFKEGKEILLPRKEFEILLLLSSRSDRVFTRDEIYSSIWGNDVIVGDRTLDVHIRKLREKIGEDFIETIKGVGYRYVNASES